MPISAASEFATPPEVRLASDNPSIGTIGNVRSGEVLFLLIILILWTIMLGVGLFISSQPYRDMLVAKQLPFQDYAFAWFMALISSTFTNVALLSGLASLAGAGARHVEAQLCGGERITNLQALYASAALRGFFVYLIALSGLMVLVENLFTGLAQSANIYLRLAGSISLLSFMLGFHPEMFARFLERIARLLEDQAAKAKS